MPTEFDIDGNVTAARAAELLGLTTARIRQLASDGWITRTGHSLYPAKALVQGYVRSLQDSHERATAKQSATSGVAEARKREIEVRTAEREKRLMEVNEHVASFELFLGMFRTSLTAVPARVTRDLPLRRTIETELNAVLSRLAAHCAKAGAELEKNGYVFDKAEARRQAADIAKRMGPVPAK